MNPGENQPSSTPDPQWDELVRNFRTTTGDSAAAETEHHTEDPRDAAAAKEANDRRLRELFSTGPGAGPRDYSPAEDEDAEDFVPQEPSALGSGDPKINLAWTGAAGGPLGLLLCVLFFRSAPGLIFILLALITVLGIGYLLYRLPKHRDPGDDGARV